MTEMSCANTSPTLNRLQAEVAVAIASTWEMLLRAMPQVGETHDEKFINFCNTLAVSSLEH